MCPVQMGRFRGTVAPRLSGAHRGRARVECTPGSGAVQGNVPRFVLHEGRGLEQSSDQAHVFHRASYETDQRVHAGGEPVLPAQSDDRPALPTPPADKCRHSWIVHVLHLAVGALLPHSLECTCSQVRRRLRGRESSPNGSDRLFDADNGELEGGSPRRAWPYGRHHAKELAALLDLACSTAWRCQHRACLEGLGCFHPFALNSIVSTCTRLSLLL